MSTFTIDWYWFGFFKTSVGRSIVHVDSNTLLGGIHVALEKFSLGWSFVEFGIQHSGMARNSAFNRLCFGRWEWNILKTTARIPVLWDHILIGDMFCLFTSSECSCFKLMSQLHHFSQLNVSIPSETTNQIHLNNRVPTWKNMSDKWANHGDLFAYRVCFKVLGCKCRRTQKTWSQSLVAH